MSDAPYTRDKIKKKLGELDEQHRHLFDKLVTLTMKGEHRREEYTDTRWILKEIAALVEDLQNEIALQEYLENPTLVTALHRHLWNHVDEIPAEPEPAESASQTKPTRRSRRRV